MMSHTFHSINTVTRTTTGFLVILEALERLNKHLEPLVVVASWFFFTSTLVSCLRLWFELRAPNMATLWRYGSKHTTGHTEDVYVCLQRINTASVVYKGTCARTVGSFKYPLPPPHCVSTEECSSVCSNLWLRQSVTPHS